jgi:hypothetical protein
MGKTYKNRNNKTDFSYSEPVFKSKYAEKQLKKSKGIDTIIVSVQKEPKPNIMTSSIETTASTKETSSFIKKDFEVAVYMIIELDSDGRFVDIISSKLRRSDIDGELLLLEEKKKNNSLLQNKIYVIKRVRANKTKEK